MAIENIVILPVLDTRPDKQVNFDLKNMRDEMANRLEKLKHYRVSESDQMGDVGDVTAKDLSSATPEWVRRLGPPDARWVMVIGLSGAQGKRVTTGAMVFGYLFDKQSGKVLWQGIGIGAPTPPLPVPYDTSQGALQNADNQANAQLAQVLTTVIFTKSGRKDVVDNAVINLVLNPSLPAQPKKSKSDKAR